MRGTLLELDDRLYFMRDLRCRREATSLFELWMLRDLLWSMDRRIDLRPQVIKELKYPWVGDFFAVSYVAGADDSSGESKKILIGTTIHMAYVYKPDSRKLRFIGDAKGALVLYQESLLQMPGMEYGNEDIKFQLFDRSPRF